MAKFTAAFVAGFAASSAFGASISDTRQEVNLNTCVAECQSTPGCNFVDLAFNQCRLRRDTTTEAVLSRDRRGGSNAKAQKRSGPVPNATIAPQPTIQPIYRSPNPPTKLPSILIPMYHSDSLKVSAQGVCEDEYFLRVAKGGKAVLAVVNPENGPKPAGSEWALKFKACLMLLGQAGVRMVGYLGTKVSAVDKIGIWHTSGMRPVKDIEADIDNWLDNHKDVPNFSGIFLDDTSNYHEAGAKRFGLDHIQFYRGIINYIKGKNPKNIIVLNPGAFVDLRLVEADPQNGFEHPADISIPIENFAKVWSPPSGDCGDVQWTRQYGNFGPGPWCPYVPKADNVEPFKAAVETHKISVAAVMHSGSREFAMSQASVAQKAGFDYFYATDRTLADDPWEGAPSFWEDYLTYLNKDGVEKVGASGYSNPGPEPGPKAWMFIPGANL
eukprot:comp17325_c0_seq1/m.16522 comp17325_c0_seq1/g.16522  ORF comp17325_c0_seq1/g.16522 comp17325_c0_seq1/m.16522 type:complete len:441 (-) comp17325_c0_seq1:477-1799(-)